MTRRFCALLALALGCACARRSDVPPGYQGIVALHRRKLGFEVGGRVRELRFERGQRVREGEALATLDDGLERPQRDAREADLRAAEAQLDLLRAGTRSEDLRAAEAQVGASRAAEAAARDAAARLRKLRSSNAAPQSQLDDAESALRKAEAERRAVQERLLALQRGSRSQDVRAAQARADAARAALAAEDARLQRFTLASPVAGVVLDRHVEPGEVVQPGAAVITIGETGRSFVDVFVPQPEMAGLQLGLRATVRTDGEPEPFDGVVEWIAQELEFSPRFLFSDRERTSLVVRVRVALDDPHARLHAGVPAFAALRRDSGAPR